MRTDRLRGFLFALSIFGLLACGQDEQPINARSADRPVPAPVMIQKPGRYFIRGGEDVLSIFEAPADALAYQVGETTEDYSNGGLISDRNQPWFFHSGVDDSVWVYDTALGVVQWSHEAGEGWKSLKLEDDSIEAIGSMPEIFFNSLPQALKERWAPLRTG